MIEELQTNMIMQIKNTKVFYNLLNAVILAIDEYTNIKHSFEDVIADVAWTVSDKCICISSRTIEEEVNLLYGVYVFDKLGDIMYTIAIYNDSDKCRTKVIYDTEDQYCLDLGEVIKHTVDMFDRTTIE